MASFIKITFISFLIYIRYSRLKLLGWSHMNLHIRSLLFSIIGWTFAIGLYLLIYLYGADQSYEWSVNKAVTIGVWLLAGVITGAFYWIAILIADLPKFRKRSYLFLIIFKTVIMLIIIVLLHLLGRYVSYLVGSIEADEIWPTFLNRMTDKNTQVFILYVMIASFVLSFVRQMSEMTGFNMLVAIVFGKYYRPKNENRLFMFLDMKGSTTIAESLGDLKFSQLIQECFHDMTGVVLKHEVEIYHYEGDAVILTWPTNKGVQNSNCINLFFDFKDVLKNKSKYYFDKYGLEPHFKAGINAGTVTVVEIGDVKREVSYLSDVLNVGDRVQHKCNEFNSELLICEHAYDLLSEEDKTGFTFKNLGSIRLKGKSNPVGVFSVDQLQE